MIVPDPHEHPDVYVPPESARESEWWETWPGRDRAEVMARARHQRLENGGLPVDEATLERVADAVLHPEYWLPGLYLTAQELEEAVPGDVIDRISEYLDEHPEVHGSTRVGWDDGRRVFVVGLVRDDGTHEAALRRIAGDRLRVERREHTVAELTAVKERIAEDDDELRAIGLQWIGLGAEPNAGIVGVDVAGGRSAEEVAELFRARYGSLVRVRWVGPSAMSEVPQPFGSWTSENRWLRLFFSLAHNGEEVGTVRVVREDAERVEVALTRREWAGVRTGPGGWVGHHVDVELDDPVGVRDVVDVADGVARPAAETVTTG